MINIKDTVQITLCRIWQPGNVGSVLRACKNFGFKNIISVNQINFNLDETTVK